MPFPFTVAPIDINKIRKAALQFRAINHLLRQQILIEINQKGSCTVMYLQNKLELDQAVTSQHLAILRRAGFVFSKRNGQCVIYSLNVEKLVRLQEISEHLLQCEGS